MDAPHRARAAFSAWQAAVSDDWFADDPHLRSLLRHHGRDAGPIAEFGPVCARVIDPLVRENNRDEHLPRLRRYDGVGNRVESVDFHPSYHQIGRLVYATGLMSRYRDPGHELDTLALLYLFAQNGEGGHACPIACTAGLIKILQDDAREEPGRHEGWLERLLDPSYDTHFHGAQFLTEVQGGSDVGANAVVAKQDTEGWRLHGEKWFCSVIDAQLFLVTARPEHEGDGTRGLRAFVVPRTLENGATNDFRVRRLKFKLGTRSMASAEVDFAGARAWPVGDFRKTVEIVLNTSRLYNAICSSAILQRSFREAWHYARTRLAFGQPILRFPAVARTVADIRVDAYAARSLTFQLAAMADARATAGASDRDAAAWRMLVNLNKFWTSVAATSRVRDAIEVLGGNGAIEEFSVLPRLLRDSIVCEAWEGGHNVLCAQALRDSQRGAMHVPMFELLAELGGETERLAQLRERWQHLVDAPQGVGALHIRDVAEALRPVAQAAVLTAELRGLGPQADPLLPTVIDHLLETTRPGYDPLEDRALGDRLTALVAQ